MYEIRAGRLLHPCCRLLALLFLTDLSDLLSLVQLLSQYTVAMVLEINGRNPLETWSEN